jgi:hypothetical protein
MSPVTAQTPACAVAHAAVNHVVESLMFGAGDKRSLYPIRLALKLQMQPNRVLIAATEAAVIRTDDGKRVRRCWVAEIRHGFEPCPVKIALAEAAWACIWRDPVTRDV